jgi:hypothetical protein
MVAYRPFALATITGSTGSHVRCFVCLDTGADACVFPLSFAKLLGLDILKMPRQMTGGVGSVANSTYYDTLTIDLGPGLRFQTLAGFLDGLEAQGIGLLGQSGFFEFYNVAFSHKQKKFTIEPV